MRLLLPPNLGDKFWFKYMTYRVESECNFLEADTPWLCIQQLWLVETFEPTPDTDADLLVDLEPVRRLMTCM